MFNSRAGLVILLFDVTAYQLWFKVCQIKKKTRDDGNSATLVFTPSTFFLIYRSTRDFKATLWRLLDTKSCKIRIIYN